jgi:catechol 2,3-dioxygenase-like lactoylglutathione lyase family enzyme
MGFHHVAIATRNLEATHRFYTEAMGFELAKVVAGKSPEGGWAKHVFYRTPGGDMIAFWDLHDAGLADDWSPALSTGLGLPIWANHIAFRAHDLDEIDSRKRRWLALGHDVMEIDHGWCLSIYTTDPSGTLVEWCTDTATLGAADRAEAERLLSDPNPPLESAPPGVLHKARER